MEVRAPGTRKTVIVVAYAATAWVLCAGVMGVGMATMSLETTLIVHAIAAPIIAFLVSSHYYRKHAYTTPLQTAFAFVIFIIFMDLFLVALVINRSFDMFTSFIGTWLPFGLIFLVTYLTGTVLETRHRVPSQGVDQ